LKEMAPK